MRKLVIGSLVRRRFSVGGFLYDIYFYTLLLIVSLLIVHCVIPPQAVLAVQVGGGAATYPEKVSGTLEVTSGTKLNNITYNWPSAQGTASTYLKNNGAGTLTWETVSAGAAGSTGYVQFNSGGALAGDSNFFWDKTNKWLGVGVTPTQARLQVSDNTATDGFSGLRIDRDAAISGSLYGLYVVQTYGAVPPVGSTNVGGYFSASGAENNYGLLVPTGNVGIGTSTPATNVHIYENNNDTEPALQIEQARDGDASQKFTLTGATTICAGVDNDDNDNFKIGNSATLTGNTYTDANTLLRIHTEAGSLGITDINHQSRCRAHTDPESIISIPGGIWTIVPFPIETYDEQAEWIVSTFTAKEDGYYAVKAAICYYNLNLGPGDYIELALYKNGGLDAILDHQPPSIAGSVTINGSIDVYLSAGEYIEIYTLYSAMLAAGTLISDPRYNYVTIHKLS